MKLAFQAKYVECADAIEGELLQVTFDTLPPGREEEDGRETPYVLISRLFEFPGTATIEWHDGLEYDGGAEIVSAALSRSRLSIQLDQGLEINVAFHISDEKFTELISHLKAMVNVRLVNSPTSRSSDPIPPNKRCTERGRASAVGNSHVTGRPRR